MTIKFAIEWKSSPTSGTIRLTRGTVEEIKAVRGEGSVSDAGDTFAVNGAFRLEVAVAAEEATGEDPVIVTVETNNNPFSFFLRDIHTAALAGCPIYIPAYGVAVTAADDERSYAQIEEDIAATGLKRNLQQIEDEPEESYEEAARNTRDLPGPTWLGLSRDVRIFEVSYRGVGGDELHWDWIQPRDHGFNVTLPETNNESVRYRFLIGRGIGCREDLTRRLDEGVFPIVHAELNDNDIRYSCTSFVSYESSKLNEDTLKGTNWLVTDGFGGGNMLTPAQEEQRAQLLPQYMEQAEETVLYFRCEATNTAKVPRYAWFKNIVPNAYIMNNTKNYTFDGNTGFVQFSPERVCAVSKVNGKPMPQEESAVLVAPGAKVVFEFYVPHRPIPQIRAERLIEQSFEERLEECREFWRGKLQSAARIKLPEQRMDEMVKAGLLHLDLVAYGAEPEGTIVPTIGVYTAIGSESAPIIQFMDSMGWAKTAARALQFFLDKQHEDGFIQNFNGYMLETGAALWSFGEHYRYTRDEAWLAEVKPKLLHAYEYLVKWRNRNLKPELKGYGYGMLEGKTADPEDPFHSFMLNGYAYIGMSRLAEMLSASEPELASAIAAEAEALREDITTEFRGSVSRSPVVPLGDGTWIPTAPPWVEHHGPLALYSEAAARWLTHGSFVARDSLLGPLYLVFQEVLSPDSQEAEFLLQFHNELMCTRNVALSQPYYSIHPWVHLKRGEVKPFLKAYYNGFAGLADRETYSFWEHYWHASPHKTHEESWFLMQTRWMLYMEEGDSLRLLPGIPRKWLEDGSEIGLTDIATYFGPVTLQVESQLKEQGRIQASISCLTDRKPRSISLRLPHPDNRHPVKVSGGVYSAENETVVIDNFDGTAEITIQYEV